MAVFNGTADSDRLTDGFENDTLNGYAGNDTISATIRANVVYGGSGDDVIYGGGTGLTLYGGVGDDRVVVRQETLAFINMGAGNDFIEVGPITAAVGGIPVVGKTIQGGSGTDTLFFTMTLARDDYRAFAGISNVGLIAYSSIEQFFVWGTGADNRMVGDMLNDTLIGFAGDDTVNGRDGNDVLYGSAGNDRVFGGYGNDVLRAGDGADSLSGGPGAVSYNLQGDFDNPDAFRDVVTYTGGLGVLTAAPGRLGISIAANRDSVSWYDSGEDLIHLQQSSFAGITQGRIAAGAFVTNTTGRAQDTSDRFIFDSDDRQLLFDADGTGSASRAVIFMTFDYFSEPVIVSDLWVY